MVFQQIFGKNLYKFKMLKEQNALRMAMAIGRDADKTYLTEFVNDLEAPVFEAHHAKDIHQAEQSV